MPVLRASNHRSTTRRRRTGRIDFDVPHPTENACLAEKAQFSTAAWTNFEGPATRSGTNPVGQNGSAGT